MSLRARFRKLFSPCVPRSSNKKKRETPSGASNSGTSEISSTPNSHDSKFSSKFSPTSTDGGDRYSSPKSVVSNSVSLTLTGPSEPPSAISSPASVAVAAREAEPAEDDSMPEVDNSETPKSTADTILSETNYTDSAKDSDSARAGVLYSVDIFHDAENCPIRHSTNGGRLYESVVATILDSVGVDVDDLDIDATCDVNWRFVLPIRDIKHFPTRTLKDLLTRGVVHINPGDKKGAVDTVIMESMERLRDDHADDSLHKKSRRIIAVISSDKDFAGPIRRMKQAGFKVVLVYTSGKMSASYANLFKPEHSLGYWEDLVDHAEMDSAELSRYAQRLSFEADEAAAAGAGAGTSSGAGVVDAAADLVGASPHGRDKIPDFKFTCARDLYLFLLHREGRAIDVAHLGEFWEVYPHHRHEIGKISNFCRSAKSEGAFSWSRVESAAGGFVLSLVPEEERKKPCGNLIVATPVGKLRGHHVRKKGHSNHHHHPHHDGKHGQGHGAKGGKSAANRSKASANASDDDDHDTGTGTDTDTDATGSQEGVNGARSSGHSADDKDGFDYTTLFVTVGLSFVLIVALVASYYMRHHPAEVKRVIKALQSGVRKIAQRASIDTSRISAVVAHWQAQASQSIGTVGGTLSQFVEQASASHSEASESVRRRLQELYVTSTGGFDNLYQKSLSAVSSQRQAAMEAYQVAAGKVADAYRHSLSVIESVGVRGKELHGVGEQKGRELYESVAQKFADIVKTYIKRNATLTAN
jgi:hypothetical protein